MTPEVKKALTIVFAVGTIIIGFMWLAAKLYELTNP